MTLFVLSYLAGALTILAPCILPVLPFVFSRMDQPFVRSGLPMLAGMALSFVAVGTLAAVGGAWAGEANEIGRDVAMALLATMGLALIAPRLADRLFNPLVEWGGRLTDAAQRDAKATGRSVLPSFVLGIATGLLWAPCAGPVLGLVLTTAALQGASVGTSLLLLAYAAGAATSLAMALWTGGRVYAGMKRALGLGEWLRKGVGIAVLAGVAAVATGLDTDLAAQFSFGLGNSVEEGLLNLWHPQAASSAQPAAGHSDALPQAIKMALAASPLPELPVEGMLPPLTGVTRWLNSEPLSTQSLRGKVVLIDFWTFGCVNCRNALPYVKSWAEKYKDEGLVVIGVHSPEFAYERNVDNVQNAVKKLGLEFPIAIDNNFSIWRAFSNQYWPAHYFIDAQGRIRFHHFGEGSYQRSEQVIRQLLDEAKSMPGPRTGT
jgi:cytochrome c biogenesis protein CcdA/thiol-disulfide isomerase/thioredoxin